MTKRRTLNFALAALTAVALPSAMAEEGMWTYNHFPAAKVKAAYGFEPSQGWLDHLRLASMRLAGGCSGSVVSPDGLVMTNHHCARSCIQNISGLTKKDYNETGFFAKTENDEPSCPGVELNQLTQITDVTSRIQQATKAVAADKFSEAQKSAQAAIEKECATSDEFRCEVVSLYRGGRYDLYKYRRLQDIRLVFAPEDRIAFFGGDPDNFNFPRYDLDVSFMRIYGHDGKPLKTPDYLAWSNGKIKAGDLTFVSGNPGRTSRTLTISQLDEQRDWALPSAIARLSELRGYITQYQERGAEEKRQSNDLLFGIENSLKVEIGQHDALADKPFYNQLVRKENDFRAEVNASPELKRQYGAVWEHIGALVTKSLRYRKEYNAIERGPISQLYSVARGIVRYGDEVGKPNGERLPEFADARLPQFRRGVLANRPVYDELDIATLTWSLTKMREALGPDDPLIKKVFGNRSPAQVATEAVQGSQLKTTQADKSGKSTGGLRKELLDGGKAAIDASKDPMIELVRAIDPAARAIRHTVETEITGPLKQQEELLARARFAVYGTDLYPDATFTLRLSYGSVAGYEDHGKYIQPFTTLAGAFERNTGNDPFALPASWLKAKAALNLATPFDFVTSNDIIGGNSGSPVVNQAGEIVGLVFDGNIESLGGEFGFDPAVNRTIAVHSAALIEALDKVYGAKRLVEELRPPK